MSNSKPIGASPGPIEHFVIDQLSVILTKLVSAPIEYVKLVLQCEPELQRSGRLQVPYTGAFNVVWRSVKADGISSLWRGVTPTLFQPLINQAVGWTGISKMRVRYDANANYFWWFLKTIAVGAAAGSITILFTYPLDYARTQLACDVSHRFSGVVDVIQKTSESDGFSSIYRSFFVTLSGIVLYRALYFGLYDTGTVLMGRARRDSFVLKFLLGVGVTLVAGWLTYPIDTVRRRMMVSLCGPLPYHTAWQCTRDIISNEGILSLWRGAGVNLVRSQVGAMFLSVLDQAQAAYLSWRFPSPPPPPPDYSYEEQQTQ